MLLRQILSLLTVLLLAATGIQAQDSTRAPLPDLYLDCQRCDYNYIRTNIDFINMVDSPDRADIHLTITDARTYGGREFTIDFRGLNRFESLRDTLIYRSRDTESAHSERIGLVRYIRVGLVPFAARTEAIDHLGIYYDDSPLPWRPDPDGSTARDPWNGWLFDLNLRSDLTEEESERQLNLHAGFYTERVTDRHIFTAEVHGDIRRRSIELSDGQVRVNRDRGEYQGLMAFALGDHLALGLYTGARFDRPYNIRLHLEASPAIEYNVFPYGQFRERRFIVRYRISPVWRDYFEETEFARNSEYLVQQSLLTQLRFDRPWGRIDLVAAGYSYFHNPDLNRLELSPSLAIRLFHGLSLTLSGEYRFINDQLFLPAGELTDLDRLTGRLVRPTSYDFRVSAGLAWTFGSRSSHVVNPRFQGL